MKYNLNDLKTNSHVKTNLDKMLRLHDLIEDWNEIKNIDETELHRSVHEVMTCSPFLGNQLGGDLKEIYKFLGAQAVLAHRVFFEDHDEELEYHHLAALLCQLHEALTAKLEPLFIEN